MTPTGPRKQLEGPRQVCLGSRAKAATGRPQGESGVQILGTPGPCWPPVISASGAIPILEGPPVFPQEHNPLS